MASKVYTAQEMREMANKLPDDYSFADIVSGDGDKQLFSMGCLSSMLRQAADAMEREEKRRDKKYEYGVRIDEDKIDRDYIFESEEYARTVAGDSLQVVRREVGEWEEVKDA